ncbi:MAG: DUF72 domain-containing protein [Nodosilinea sp.]
MAGFYFTGCAVWAYKPWVGGFYPKGSKAGDFLRLYGDRMTAVEGNTTFYSWPDAPTVARWAATMPPGFRFCPKLPKAISHQGKLTPLIPAAQQFLQALAPLEERLGPMFMQLPPTYSPAQFTDLKEFLTQWSRLHSALTVEVRHLDWFQEPHQTALNQMLETLGVGRVLLDTRPIYEGISTVDDDPQLGSERKKPEVPLQPVTTAPFTLVRYISHPTMAINEPYLAGWVPWLRRWLAEGKQVYFFAHCPQEVKSPVVARAMYHRLQAAGVALPPLPWDEIEEGQAEADSGQLSLF